MNDSLTIAEVAREFRELLAQKDAKIERLKLLNAQAAQALEKWNIRHRFSELIDELKAAQ